MKLSAFILLSLISAVLPISTRADEARFFPVKGMEFGVYYYPEHWPEDQWERDIQRISKLGFHFIHCAEFAWARLEPEDGRFDFAWLDRVVDLAGKSGLKVVMCTPSPCIPAWLAIKHPEVLAMDNNGKRSHHDGGRLNGSLANPIYQKYAARIATEMAKHYGKDARISGWQIGNEPHIGCDEDYSPSAQEAFIGWLKNKYKTIESLNEAWGAAFWSFTLNDFSQLEMPSANPHAMLDFKTYTSEEIARDLIDQTRILRQHVNETQWITTNYAYYKGLPNVNPFLTRKDMDFASHTMYLTHNRMNSSGDSLAHRLGCGMELSFSTEVAKSVSGYTGIMELQPGQINWGRFNSMPLPGAVRMWIWHCFGMGERFVCTYRYRQPLYGLEQFHHGIMQTDGVSLSQGGQDYATAIGEIGEISKKLEPGAVNDFVRSTRTGFLWSNRNIIDIESYRHHQDWDTWQHIYTYYQGLKRMGVDVEFVTENDAYDPQRMPFLVVPAYQMMSMELVKKLESYASRGGHLIISTRSALKDQRGHLWEAKIQQPIWSLIGGEIEFYDHLPKERPGMVQYDGKNYPWHTWGTVVKPAPKTESWGFYDDQFYKGKSSVLHRKDGKGSVTYLGAWSDGWDMEYQILRRIYGQVIGKLPFDLPPYVFAHYREGLWVAVNYTDKVTPIPVPDSAEVILGGRNLPPAGVLVWREKK
ncbi:MAG: beta-galactosidase [Verrucomicrobiota bacterium]